MKVILPCYSISLELEEVCDHEKEMYDSGHSGGTIETSGLKEECPHCNEVSCEGDCFDALEHIQDRDLDERNRKQKEVNNRNIFNGMMDTIESMILAHAVAGIDVCSPAYVEGIETAVQTCAHVMED